MTLICTYPDENGKSLQYTYVDTQPVTDSEPADRNDSLDFVVKKPGHYQVVCQIGNSQQSNHFVIEDPGISRTPQKPSPLTCR